MNSTEILDAVNARLLEKWSERTVYINVCPEDYERPSFWLEVTRDDRTPVTQRMTKRNVQIRLTLHDEADEHYDISWARLNNDVSACLKLMMQVLHVGARRLLPQLLQSMPRDVDRAAILLNFEFMESNEETAPEIPTADSYQISVQVNGGEIYQRSE